MHSIHLIRFWKQKEVINLCNQAQKSMTFLFAIMVCWVTALTVSWCFRVKSVWNGLLWAALGSWVLKWEVYIANTMLSCGNKSASVVLYLEGQVLTLLLHYNQVPKENGWSTKGHKQILNNKRLLKRDRNTLVDIWKDDWYTIIMVHFQRSVYTVLLRVSKKHHG